jgi:cysteine desulfurase
MFYLDHNATSPVDPRVTEALLPYLGERYGNPSSVHRAGRLARAALDRAREEVAALVGAQPGQVIFTSGGTEANNLALLGSAGRLPHGRLAVSTVEHPSVLAPAEALAEVGWRLDWLPVDADGRLRLAECRFDGVALASLMWANNETGTLQPVVAFADRVRAAGGIAHSDAVQAAGKVALDFPSSGLHAMTLSAHKIGGPKGVGALVVDRALDLAPQLRGGGQERGARSGTENLPGIVGFGVAARLARESLEAYARATRALTDRLLDGLRQLPGVTLFATGAERLPNTLMFALAGFDGEALLLALDAEGLAVSSGSACHSGSGEASHVLRAMGVETPVARGAIRVSSGRETPPAAVDALLAALERCAGRADGWAVAG